MSRRLRGLGPGWDWPSGYYSVPVTPATVPPPPGPGAPPPEPGAPPPVAAPLPPPAPWRVMPWVYPPPDAVPVVAVSAATTVGPGATVTLFTAFTVPAGSEGVIVRCGLSADAFTDLRVSVRVAGAPVQPLIRIDYAYGALSDPRPIPGPGIWVRSGQLVDAIAENVGTAAIQNVRLRLDAYYWPIGGLEG